MSIDFAIAQLRHLYQQMLDGQVRDTAQAARYLLGPAIEDIERAETERARSEWEGGAGMRALDDLIAKLGDAPEPDLSNVTLPPELRAAMLEDE